MVVKTSVASPLAHFNSPSPSEWELKTSLSAVFAIVVTIIVYQTLGLSSKVSDSGVYDLGGIPIVTAWAFFTKRYDFIRQQFTKTKGDPYQFQVLKHRVVALGKRTELRKAFFTEPGFSLTDGYRLMTGGFPFKRGSDNAPPPKPVEGEDNVQFYTLFPKVFSKERLEHMIPVVLSDTKSLMQRWGRSGKMDPFDDVYELIFQIIVRVSTCPEIANDPVIMRKIIDNYAALEKSATPACVLLPWLPTPARISNIKSLLYLAKTFMGYVKQRRNAPVPTNDTIDFLINFGKKDGEIVEMIMGVVMAGVVNTGVNSAWALMYLAAQRRWRDKLVEEFETLLNRHTVRSNEPLHQRLATIPLEAWEEELPLVDAVIREIIRLHMNGAALRRNVGKDITLGDDIEVKFKHGDFAIFSVADIHLNSDIYSNPNEFDPDRFSATRQEDKKHVFSFVGWGVGRHPCPGQRLAKLEMKLIMASFLLSYDFELVDRSGNSPKEMPQPDRNNLHEARPLDTCYLKYKRFNDNV